MTTWWNKITLGNDGTAVGSMRIQAKSARIYHVNKIVTLTGSAYPNRPVDNEEVEGNIDEIIFFLKRKGTGAQESEWKTGVAAQIQFYCRVCSQGYCSQSEWIIRTSCC